jgi:PAS domain S-box-containing protein
MKKSAAAVPSAEKKGFADEIDRLVAQRTAELIAANEQLKKELAELKRAERAEHEGEFNFDLIVNSIPVPVAVTSPSGEVEALNQPTLQYFGKTFEELKGWKSSEVVHPDDLERTVAAQIEAHVTGSAYHVESRHRRADGTYRWFNVLGLPLRDAEGNILRWFHLLIDIDDRKKAEERLNASERNLTEIINTVPTHIYVLNADGSVQHVNEAVINYTGLTLEDVQQEDYRDRVIHPEDFKRVREQRAASLRRTAPFSTEQRVLGIDGQYRWFLVHYKPWFDEQGRIVRWYVAAFDIEDKKRAEAERKQTEETFRMIVETNPECVKVIDRDGTLLRVNAAGLTMSGAPSEQMILGQCFYDFLAPEDRDRYREFNEKVCSGHKGFLEFDIINMQGERHHMETHAAPMPTADGSIVQLGVTRDITERKLTLKRLQANQELLDLAQKSAGAMAFDWYIQEDLNFWSAEQEELFGLPPGGFDGTYKTWKNMMYAPDWPVVVAAIQHAQQTGQVEAEYRVVWPDGSLHWLSTNGRMFFDEGGQPLRMVGFTSDVTKRKLIEEEMRRSEAFLAEAQRLSLTGSFSWRPDTDVMIFSEQARSIFGFGPEQEVTLNSIGSRVHPDDRPATNERIAKAREVIVDQDFENRLRLPDGTIKYIHTIARAMQREDGGMEYIGAVQDITDRQRSEIALGEARSELAQAASAMSLGVLTAAIAHEVNQPLSGIVMNASTCTRMLDADPPNLKGARETIQRTIRDGHRAADVIARLRALFTKKDLTFETIDLNEAAREVIALSLSDLQRNQVVLRSHQAENLPPVAGDRVQLQQVILNLVRNAIDAMSTVDDRPRHLLVKTEPDEDDMVRLTVQDSGVGVDPHTLKKLFEAFYTTKNDGMGIGLSVSRSIIESHHGRLWATANDGPGTAFSFSIPRA